MENIPPKTRVTSGLLNGIIDQANRVDTTRIGGMGRSVGPGGVNFFTTRDGKAFIDGAQRCTLVNRDPEGRAIGAFEVAAILTDSDEYNASTRNTYPGILQERGFHVQHAATGSDGQLVIAAERIPYNGTGIGYCAGVCAAYIDDDTKAAIEAAGSPVILHEEVDSAGDPVEGEHRWAVVRFGGGGATLRRIRIGGGKEFPGDPGKFGLVGTASDLSSVASAYDPALSPTVTEDGLGYGELEDGTAVMCVSARVVVGGVVRGGGVHQYDLYAGIAFTAWRQITIPVATGGTISAWEVYLLG